MRMSLLIIIPQPVPSRCLGGEGRVEGTEADVGVGDARVGGLGLDVGGDARGGAAGAALGAEAGRVDGVGGVEPQHVGRVVVPDGHDEDHVAGEGLAHAGETAALVEDVLVAEGRLLGVAVVLGDRVAADARDCALAVGDDLAVLDVEALDLAQFAAGLDELRDDGDLLGGVDGEALAVEALVALAVRVEVASVGVAVAGVAVRGVGTAAGVALARVVGGVGAGVRSIGAGDAVGLPDIHLSTASTKVTNTGVDIVARGLPSFNVGLAVDELEVTRALGVTVACTVLGTGSVTLLGGEATIEGHGDEVQSTVQAATGDLVRRDSYWFISGK